jgi:hypothetical protein
MHKKHTKIHAAYSTQTATDTDSNCAYAFVCVHVMSIHGKRYSQYSDMPVNQHVTKNSDKKLNTN